MNKLPTITELMPQVPKGFRKMSADEKRKAVDDLIASKAKELGMSLKDYAAAVLIGELGSLIGELAKPEPENDPDGKPYPICEGCGKRHKPRSRGTFAKLAAEMTYSIDPADLSHDETLNALVTDYRKRGGPRVHWHSINEAGLYDIFDDIVSIPKPLEAVLEPDSGMTPEEQHRRTVCHECAHSTGHKSRLKRKMENGISDGRGMAYEEMVADRATQMILSATGMMTPALKKSTEAYLKHFAAGFEENEGMTYGEARQLVEEDAKAAAELVLGKKLERKRKATAVSPAEESKVLAEAK